MAEAGPCLFQPGARWSQLHKMSHLLPVYPCSFCTPQPPRPHGFNANVTDGFGYLFIYLFMPYWKGHLSSVLFKLLSTGLGDLVIDFLLERAESPVKILAN